MNKLWELYLAAIPALADRAISDEAISKEALTLAKVALKHWEKEETK